MKIYDLDLKFETESTIYGEETYYIIEARVHPMHLIRGFGATPAEAFENFFESVATFRPSDDPPNRNREIL